jgi:hypothetical protein
MASIVAQFVVILVFVVLVVLKVATFQRSYIRPSSVQALLFRIPILALRHIGFRQRLLARFRCTRGTERRNLDDLAAEKHVRQAKASANQAAIAEQFSDLLRQRIRRDVKILWLYANEQVADTTAYQKRHETGIAQAIQHSQRIG